MNKRVLLIGGGVIVLVLVWALFRPELLFIDKTVNESYPGGTAAQAAPPSTPPTPSAISPDMARATAIRMGVFHSVAHETRGMATVHQLAGGKRILRLTEFATSNGPDVRVLLVAAADAKDNDAVKNGMPLELAKLKGNVGDQNYDLPAGADLDQYKAVVIWCKRFGVNFGAAPLK